MKLFEPGKIGALAIKNRIVMAPMGIGGLAESDGRLSRRAIDYYAARAKGGVGLIITSLMYVSRELEHHPTIPMVESNVQVSRLSELADAVHDYGAKLCVQLTAGFGRVASPEQFRKNEIVAPSASECFWDRSITARELRVEEIDRLIASFEMSAGILRIAGVDAVELHGHEGYLFDQFKTALWNKRTDRYGGGTLPERLRFSLGVIDAIRRGAGETMPVIYRFGLSHFIEGGRDVEEGLELARLLEDAGVEALHVDAGCYESFYWPHPTTYQPPACMTGMAEMSKKRVGIPVITVGKLGYPGLAEKIIAEGKADFIALGRALLADPDWPNKVREGRFEDIRPCIGDHEGCLDRIIAGKYISCSVNPAAGMEREFTLKPTDDRKSVLVVGGGPGGMEAARVSALRGHSVTLWERGRALGGNLIPASVPPFKKDYRAFIEYLSNQVEKLGVRIELEREATVESVLETGADIVMIATGGEPIIPDIDGVNRKNVITAVDALLDIEGVGDSVLVIGGGLMGCETALYLAQLGKKATIVEIMDRPARHVSTPNRMHLLKLLEEAHVKIHTETTVSEITHEGIDVADKHGQEARLDAQTVILSVGLRPNDRLAKGLRENARGVHVIGDCVRPRKVMDAVWEGFRTARLI